MRRTQSQIFSNIIISRIKGTKCRMLSNYSRRIKIRYLSTRNIKRGKTFTPFRKSRSGIIRDKLLPTTLSDNAWHIGAGGTASGTPTARTGTTRRAVNGGANLAVFDNGGAITPAGSNTIQMTGMNSSFGSILWGMSLAPYVAAATSTYPALELAGN